MRNVRKISAVRASISSIRTHAWGRMIRSAALFVRSRSCQRGTFSKAGVTSDRTIRESEQTFSEATGFSFWAIVELPTCRFVSKASATSPISVRCRFRTSVQNFSSDAAMFARSAMNSAYRSRPTTCVAASSTPRPRSRMTAGWMSRAYGPNAAPVPTAPDILPTTIRGDASRNRSLCRATSDAKTAILSPNVIGIAACPCVRPSITVRLCFDARPANTVVSSPRSSPTMWIASRSWSAVAVSRMSLLVAPRWTYLPASPSHASVRARTTAMRSCRVSTSSACTRLTVTCFVVAFAAISAPAGSGINPTFASARARAASTSRSRWRRASSSKIPFIFGRPYRKSIGQSRDMATREGKARTRYGAFLSGTRRLLFRLLRFEDFDVPDLSQEHRFRFARQEEIRRLFVQAVPRLVPVLAERIEVAVLVALHHDRHVVPAEAQDRAERTAVRPSRWRVLLQQPFVLLRPRLEVLVPAFLDVPELNPDHNRPSVTAHGPVRH